MYLLEYDSHWDRCFQRIPPSVQRRFEKHIEKYQSFPSQDFRHEHHAGFFVDEIGQYRVCFTCDETLKIRKFCFIGKHKNYERFLGTRNRY